MATDTMGEIKESSFQGPIRPPLAMPSAPGMPSTPTGTNPSPVRPKLYRRQSRFTEEPMTERTPACSASIHSFDPSALDDPNVNTLTHTNTVQQFRTANRTVSRDLSHRSSNLRRDLNSFSFGGAPATPVLQEESPTAISRTGTLDPPPQPLSSPTTAEIPPPSGPLPLHQSAGLSPEEKRRVWLRLANSVLHSAPTLVLLYIMSTSISAFRSTAKFSSPGITLLSILYLDAILNIITCFRIRSPWPRWRLSLRFLFGLGYMILFFVYIGLGNEVFPKGYTYWNVSDKMATPLVYIFLWWLAAWDLAHLPVCRPELFRCARKREGQQEGRRPSVALSELHPTSFRARVPSSVGGESVVSYTWRRWVQRTRTHSTGGVHFHEMGHNDVEMGPTRTRTREGDVIDEGESISGRRSESMRTGTAHSGEVTLRGDEFERRSGEKEKEAEAGGAGKRGEEGGRLEESPKTVRAADVGQ